MNKYPLYYDYGYLCKVVSETEFIQVNHAPWNIQVAFLTNEDCVKLITGSGKEITKQEFDRAFELAKRHINNYTSNQVFNRNRKISKAINNLN